MKTENSPVNADDALSPYKREEWTRLTPGERLRRSWRLRKRLVNPTAIHDRKLFPKLEP